MKENCEFCREKFSDTVLKEYRHWEIQLFKDQYYLGRTLIKLKRHAVDITDLQKDEREELFEKALPELENALDSAFSPDLYNQSKIGNACRHLHLHLIPRYKSVREFEGEEFEDENWKGHCKTSKADKKVSDETFNRIKSRIEEEIE